MFTRARVTTDVWTRRGSSQASSVEAVFHSRPRTEAASVNVSCQGLSKTRVCFVFSEQETQPFFSSFFFPRSFCAIFIPLRSRFTFLKRSIEHHDRRVLTCTSRPNVFSIVTRVYVNWKGIRCTGYLQDSYSCVGGSLKLRVLRQFTIS